MRITLDRWAAQNFDPPPHPNTLRRWARDGLIVPPPVKCGRAYYVDAGASYAGQEVQNEPAQTEVEKLRRTTILDRIRGARGV